METPGSIARPRRGFTLAETLVSISVLAILVGISIPVVAKVKISTGRVISARSLSQLITSGRLYLNDHANRFWPYEQSTATGEQWWYGFETWQSIGMPEGQRTCDYSQGPLGPYTMTSGGIKTDPTFLQYSPRLKPKYQNGNYGYGYNTVLAADSFGKPRDAMQVADPGEMIVFATCAQVNTFEAPASLANPMIEEFYLISDTDVTAHFRLDGDALAAFLDGSVRPLSMANDMQPGTQDMRIPSACIGEFKTGYVRQPGW
ncbi:MAG TPA: prepilin-type N-terminal cleavage/methylation domain-containing protein [Chthoniobacteraceae bacterium]|jgi:prepilin-type N-terminal cleavage/methylation domain-containing protein|nr:prepilin-type N-terminal cleavage/methylation domain-containing protein [Chthoniobacteraceae bacterium]